MGVPLSKEELRQFIEGPIKPGQIGRESQISFVDYCRYKFPDPRPPLPNVMLNDTVESMDIDVDDSLERFHRLKLRPPKSYLEDIPVEMKSMIMRRITSFQALYALTQASVTYYLIGQRDNLFARAAFQDLASRNISILPRDFNLPESLEFFDITVCVSSILWHSSKYGALESALRSYCRQFRDRGGNVRLHPAHCASLLSLVDVVKWDFLSSKRPAELARHVYGSEESITSIKDLGSGPKYFYSRSWEVMMGDKCRWQVVISKCYEDNDPRRLVIVNFIRFRIYT